MTSTATPQTRHHASETTSAPLSALQPRSRPLRATALDMRALTGIRIALAMWLVIHHTARWLLLDSGIDPDSFAVLRQGRTATCGFFILSGIVLTCRYHDRFSAQTPLRDVARFLRVRWSAVWPLGAVGALIAVPYELMEQRLGAAEFVAGLAINVALLQSWFPVGGGLHGMTLRFNGPTWTLSTLIALYAAFPFIMWMLSSITSRRGLVLLGLLPWCSVTVTAALLAGEPFATWMMHVSPFIRIADFLVGIAIGAWVVRYGAPSVRRASALQVGALILTAALIIVEATMPIALELKFGALSIIPMSVLMLSLTRSDGPLGALFSSGMLVSAGTLAFAVSMVHSPILGMGWHLGLVRPDRPWGVGIVLGVSLLVAYAVHRWIEVPMRSRLRGSVVSMRDTARAR